jgi:hypothetical protein
METIGNRKKETVYSVRSVPNFTSRTVSENQLRVDGWSNKTIVGQSPAGKKVVTEAENIVKTRHQAASMTQ